MKKIKAFAFALILLLLFTACGQEEQGRLTVFSFSGKEEQFSVSNGVIVLSDAEEIFHGGDLKAADGFSSDAVSYTTTFYLLSGNEKKVFLSNAVHDMTGAGLRVPQDLGQVSGEHILPEEIKTEDINALNQSFYFELIAVNQSGEERVYQLPLSLTEITKNAEQ